MARRDLIAPLLALLLGCAAHSVAAQDTDSTISEPAASPFSALIKGTFRDALTVRVTDLGTADGLATTVDAVVFHVAVGAGPDDATGFDWQLVVGASTFTPTAVTATTVTFSSAGLLVAADGAFDDMRLDARITAGNSSDTIDGKSVACSVSDTDFTINASGSSLAGSQTVSATTAQNADIVATQVLLVTSPSSPQNVGTAFGCSVEYADGSGARDTNVSDTIVASRTDAGAITSGASTAAVSGLATFSINCGMPGRLGLTLRFTDQAAGAVDFSASPVDSAAFNLIAANDADSTVTAGALVEPGVISSIAAANTDVFDFTLTDAGTSDGQPTAVTAVVISVGGTGAPADHTWRLNGPGVANVLGSVGAGTITFAGLSISVADGGNATYTLRLTLAATPAGTQDNETFTFSASSTSMTLGAPSTSFVPGAPVTNGAGMVYSVDAVKVRVFTNPGASQSVGAAFGCSVEYTDTNNNRDRDISDSIDAARSDAGAITSGGTAAAINGLATFNITCGAPGALGISLSFTDQAGGSKNFSGAPVSSTTFNLVASDDADSTLTAGPLSEPTTNSSVNLVLTDVFDFRITDLGTSDGKATAVTAIVIAAGGTGALGDHTWRLNGPDTANVLGSVGAGTITFAGLSISVANNSNEVYTLRMQMPANPAGTQDNETFTFSLAPGGITLGGTSTSFAVSPPVTNGAGMAYSVDATKVRVFSNPTSPQNVGAAFGCSVEYTDANNNRDSDITDSIDATRNDAGTISAGGTATAVGGLATFSITCGMPGRLGLVLNFTDQAGGAKNFSGSPVSSSSFNLIAANDADSTISEGAAGAATLPSSSGLTGVFNLVVTDLGTSDGLSTIVNGLTFNITISGGSDDALDFNWQLFNGSTTFSPSAVTATTVSFSASPLRTIANNASGTFTLRAQVSTTSATIDNKTIGVNVTSADVITSASGTTHAASQSVTKAATTTVTVLATQIQIVQQPGASESVGVSFTVTVQYADAQGNRDLNATDAMSVARNDAGTITLPSPAQGTAVSGLATFNMTLGLPGNLGGTLRLTYTDLSGGGFNFSGSPKNTNTFILIAGNDANSTISESPAGPATLASSAALTAVFSVQVNDLGTSDGLATTVNGVTFSVTVSGSGDSTANFTWQLFNGSATFAPTGTTANTVSFSAAPLLTVSDSGSGTLTLRAQVAGASATLDNKTLDIQVTTSSFTIAGGTTSLAASQTVNNLTNTQITVTATQLRFIGVPPSAATVNTTIPVSVEYTDTLGNRDLNASGAPESVGVSWSGAGAVQNGNMNPASGVCNFGTNNLRLGAPGLIGGMLTFTDNGAGVNVGAVNISPFNLTDNNDANSQVLAGPALEPATVGSMTAGFTNVFDFRLNDQGTSDGLPTLVTAIVIAVSGTASAGEHTWRLNGPAVTNVIGAATATTITFSGLSINVPNGGAQDFTLSLQLAATPTLTTDNTTFTLTLANTGVTTSGSTTTFTASSTNNGTLTYTVAATRLTVKTQPGASQTAGVGFDVRVGYTDTNGNVDVNVTDSISTMVRSDAGTVTAPAFPIAAVSGMVNLTGASQVVLGLPAAGSISLQFTDNAAGVLNAATVSTNNFALNDSTVPAVTGAQLLVGTDPRGRTVRVSFTEPLKASTAVTLTNYTLSFAGLHPTSITQPTTSQVDLVFPDYAVAGLDTLAISGIEDVASNPMVPVAAQPISSADAAAPTLVSITYNDSDGTSTPTPGDQYLFLFSEAINDRIFTGGTSANTALSPLGLSYGTPNNVSFGDDQGLATDSRLVIVTLVAGLTITGSETITLSGVTDISGNTAAATALTLTVIDNISPRLVLTRLDDRDNNGNASLGDELHVYFSEAINLATVPLVNTAGQLDAALAVSGGGSFGTDATAAWAAGNKELLITLGTGSPSIVGRTLNPPATVTDPAGNPDATSPAVAIASGTSDIFAPSFTIAYSASNPNAVPVGNLRVTATFTDTQPTPPTIAINQPGLNDLPATNMVAVGGTQRVWQFDWNVSFADGTINIDGINVVTITGRPTDLRGNALVPASNNTFRTDTTTPIFSAVVVADPDNYYRSGDTISLLATLNEPGLTVTANLSVVDSALGTAVPFTDNGNGTYSLTSAALALGTLIEGSNVAIVVLARDLALNSSTVPVLVNIDDTPPTATLLYDQPSAAVGAGNLTITLSLSEPSPTVPTIDISGLAGTPPVIATPMTGSAGQSSFTFVLNVINPTTGTAAVVIANVSDLAGNPPASVANASFTVDTQNTPLVANAGPDQNLSLPQQVTLNALGSTGANRTYAWVQDSGPPVTLSAANTGTPTFYVQVSGAYVFRVTVTSGLNSADDTVTINLQNTLPYVDAGRNITLGENDVTAGAAAIGLAGDAFDVNGDTLFITWSLLSSPPSGNLVPQAPAQLATDLTVLGGAPIVAGVYRFQLTVFDPIGLGASTPSVDSIDVIVLDATTIPPHANAGPDLTATVGQNVAMASLGSGDVDGTLVAWQWRPISRPAGSVALPTGAASATAHFTPDKAGVYEFGLRVIDNANLVSAEDTLSIVVHDQRAATFNRVPRAQASLSYADTDSNNSINTGEAVTLDGAAFDADGESVTLTWRQLAGPEVLRILDPGAPQATFTPATAGSYRVRLEVLDASGGQGVAAEVSFVVAPAAAVAPQCVALLVSGDDSDGNSHVLFIPGIGVDNQSANPNVDLDGFSSTGASLTFAWRQVSGPTVALTGLTLAGASFVPPSAGVYEFELTVTDSTGLSSVHRVRFAVGTFDATANPTGRSVPTADAGVDVVSAGSLVTLSGAGADADGMATALAFHWVQVEGPPVVLDTTVAAQPRFVPPAAGTYVFELYVSDGDGYSLADSVTVIDTSSGGGGGSDGGGGCSAGENAGLALLLALALLALMARRRARVGALWLLVAGGVAFSVGCGPIALAIEGGTAGGFLATSKKKKDKGSNAAPVVIINALVREDSPATIQYALLDAESNAASVVVQYRVGSGSFADCTQGAGGDSTSGLATSPPGTSHTFEWDFVADLGSTSLVSNVSIRISANDGRQGGFSQLDNLAIGNDAPVAGSLASSESSGLFLVTFLLSDTSSDVGSVAVAYSIDQAQTWTDLNPATNDFFGNPPLNLLSAPAGVPGQFIWNSPFALPNFDGDVFLRLVPSDLPGGYSVPTEGSAVVHGPIHVRNTANTAPRLKVLTPLTGSVEANRLAVEFTLADDQSHPGEVFVEWSLDGNNFSTATLANQTQQGVAGPFVTNPAPSRYELVWEALVDFQATADSQVFLRLTPRDAVAGTPQVYGPLTVFGNTAPEVGAVTVSGSTGLVQVTINVTDTNSDRIAIVAEMIISGTPTVLASADFSGADLTNLRASPTGEDNVLVWDTNIALAGVNQSAVTLRITPSDLPSTFPAATLAGQPFTSLPFGIVNNAAGLAPTRVLISAPPTVPFGSAFFVPTSVQPGGANQSVSMLVVEGPAYGTVSFFGTPFNMWAYFAPSLPPAAFRPYVTLRAISNADPTVFGEWRMYWGDNPGGVSVGPAGQSLLLGDSATFSAAVAPGSAPQVVSWKVVEGPAAGSIDTSGVYRAPLTMPPSTTVTIRATAVNGAIGSTTLTLAPRPNRVIVNAAGGAATLALDGTLQFSAQVNPFPETVQTVRWRVVFDGEDRGSGDAVVGTVSPTGLYTAPHFLPRPISVQLEAASATLPAVSGRATLTLTAPLPTSFDVTPATITLSAGGRGQQFGLANLLPDNASAAVVWTRSPALGTIDTEGRYTPPSTLVAQTVVLVTATSAVSSSVVATASITLLPQTGVIPTSVAILPNTLAIPAGGAPVRFLATVSPNGAPQTVVWRVVSGGGSINASGVYTPPASAIDAQVTLRATSDANGSIFDEYTLTVTGSGNPWSEIAATAVGRDQPSGLYDPINNYFWIVGGKSEASGERHDTGVFAYDLATNRWRGYAPVGAGSEHNTISAVIDLANGRLLAVVGNGISQVEIFALNLTGVTTTTAWSAVAAGGGANAPVLPENFRYLTFWDPGTPAAGDEQMVVIKDGALSHAVHRFNTSTDAWLLASFVNVTSGPREPHACGYVYDSVNNRHFVLGEPGELSPGSGLNVWRVNVPGVSFTVQAQTGTIPSGFLKGAQAAYDSLNTVALVFGGDRGQAGFSATLFTLDLDTPGLAAWNTASLGGEAVPARADGAFAVVGTRALLFGGRDAEGAFGDLFDFNLGNLGTLLSVSVAGLSPIDFVPQGRHWAAGAWVPSLDEGYFFGGLAPHGESSELWVLDYDSGLGTVSWSRVVPAGSVPAARAGASLVLDAARNRLVLFGGFSGAAVFSDVHAFDLASRQWSLLAPTGSAPLGRWASAVCLDQDRMFVYGGKQNADLRDFSTGLAGDLHVLDFSASTDGAWSQPAVFAAPDARMGASAGIEAATGRLLVHGGFTQASQSNGQLYALDVSTGQWSAPGIANGSFRPGTFGGACAYAASVSRFICALPGLPQAQALVVSSPKANWQTLAGAAGEHAFGANGLFDEANNRFIVAFGQARQYGVDAGTNRVSVIEFK